MFVICFLDSTLMYIYLFLNKYVVVYLQLYMYYVQSIMNKILL